MWHVFVWSVFLTLVDNRKCPKSTKWIISKHENVGSKKISPYGVWIVLLVPAQAVACYTVPFSKSMKWGETPFLLPFSQHLYCPSLPQNDSRPRIITCSSHLWEEKYISCTFKTIKKKIVLIPDICTKGLETHHIQIYSSETWLFAMKQLILHWTSDSAIKCLQWATKCNIPNLVSVSISHYLPDRPYKLL